MSTHFPGPGASTLVSSKVGEGRTRDPTGAAPGIRPSLTCSQASGPDKLWLDLRLAVMVTFNSANWVTIFLR